MGFDLAWCHQKLNFKDGEYKVRHERSQDLLVIERSGRALIGLNDHGSQWLSAWVATDFGANAELHDYSGANRDNGRTNGDGWFEVWVPPMGYVVWGPAGISGGFDPPARRTTQEFQLDDDLGDRSANSPGYGGKIRPGEYRKAGAIWAAADSLVDIWVYTDGERDVELLVHRPDTHGGKSEGDGSHSAQGRASNGSAVHLEFTADREGYHQLSAKLTDATEDATRAFVKVTYMGPASSGKF